MKKIILILLVCTNVFSQSIFEQQKQNWMNRDGKTLDGDFNLAYNFLVWFAKGTQEQHYPEVQQGINDLLNGDSWQGGNYASALIGAQLYYYFGDKLHEAERLKLWGKLKYIPADKYYFGNTVANTGINTMAVRYILSQYEKATSVVYNVADNTYGPPNFTYEGRAYVRGQSYSSYNLARDYLYYWFDLLLKAGYLQGELFTEIYGIHFINALVTLADSRMVQDPEMRKRAKLIADFFLLEHVVNTNDHHLAGPLGRSYMQLHLDGTRHFFYWDCYWGKMFPTHYGHPDGPFILDYRVTPLLEDIGRYNDEPADYTHLVRSNIQGGRNVFITQKYTLGSNPNDGGWLLEINSNDPGPYPKARPGMPFRIWLNEYDNDLNPAACSGECYSQMGTHAHQYKNALLVNVGNARLYEALTTNRWDVLENDASGWRFSVENNVAVAIRQGPASSAVEVARLGIDYANLAAFKNAILATARLGNEFFVTSRGDRIEARYNQTAKQFETWVNNQRFWQAAPRLEVISGTGEKIVESDGKTMILRKHGKTGTYNFSTWSYSEGGVIVDREPPAPPRNVEIIK